MGWLSSSRHRARPPDHLCGLGYSPADARQSATENEVCRHAERLLNMVHAYCEIRDSWIGWLRGDAMNRTLYERIVPEMRALQGAERRVIDTPSVTLLAVLDYAARARKAVPAYTPRETVDYPQPPLADDVREACGRMAAQAEVAERAARRASARAYAARMADAIERERAEEQRRQRAMKEHGVTETPEDAARAKAQLEARIAVYQRELDRVSAQEARRAEGPTGTQQPAPPPDAPAPETARMRAILAAMRAWAGPRLKWGRNRRAPYLRALRRATGLADITRAERNRLWRTIEAEPAS
ncbi:MAG: hypothetical protein OXK73_16275 [Rhodospirillaceae bacterium]|nr:hypothetical protein [Rhodospirillaceae bacterium]